MKKHFLFFLLFTIFFFSCKQEEVQPVPFEWQHFGPYTWDAMSAQAEEPVPITLPDGTVIYDTYLTSYHNRDTCLAFSNMVFKGSSGMTQGQGDIIIEGHEGCSIAGHGQGQNFANAFSWKTEGQFPDAELRYNYVEGPKLIIIVHNREVFPIPLYYSEEDYEYGDYLRARIVRFFEGDAMYFEYEYNGVTVFAGLTNVF